MLRIAVCDDVPVFVEILSERIESWAKDRYRNIQLKKFFSGEELLMEMEEKGDFTAVFIDIELGRMSGIETARRMKEKSRLTSIVFVSQHQSYFRQMFRFYPFQYIEKPISEQRVHEVLDQIMEIHRCLYETYSFVHNRVSFRITLREVLYFTSERRMIRTHMVDGREFVHYEKLNELEKKLTEFSNRFIRIHQSYLVNTGQIEQFHRKYVMMCNLELLPISRKQRKTMEQYHLEMLRKEFENF